MRIPDRQCIRSIRHTYAGIVTYSNEAKEKYLHVKHETLLLHGAVSYETAYEMARGCVDVCGTDCGIATTGIAGPGGGTPEKPVGTVFVAISTKDGERVKPLHLTALRDRATIRTHTANEALAQVFSI